MKKNQEFLKYREQYKKLFETTMEKAYTTAKDNYDKSKTFEGLNTLTNG